MTSSWIRKWLLAMLVGLELLASTSTQAGPTAYSLAIVPQFPAVEIHRDWTPLIERLSRETGLSFSLEIAPTIPKFEDMVLAGTPDFAFMNPYHEVMAMRAHGYLPLVRDRAPLSGILVVRKDSPIRSVKELDGQSIAFPAPNAFGASLWLRALLAEREKIQFTPVYVNTHSNTYRHVAIGLEAAGGGIRQTLTEEPEALRETLRVLLETPGVPAHPLSAHPRVPDAVRQAVAHAFMRMADDAQGQLMLKNVQMAAPTLADYARDYQMLERYGLDKYVVRAKP